MLTHVVSASLGEALWTRPLSHDDRGTQPVTINSLPSLSLSSPNYQDPLSLAVADSVSAGLLIPTPSTACDRLANSAWIVLQLSFQENCRFAPLKKDKRSHIRREAALSADQEPEIRAAG